MDYDFSAPRFGPPARLYRIVSTTSRRYGYHVQTWNRFTGKWQHQGFARALRMAKTQVRFGIAAWVEVA
jgi:hypothetical protein